MDRPLTRKYRWGFNTLVGSYVSCHLEAVVMALDSKSRTKRYEKLDFLGEGQVLCAFFYFSLSGYQAAYARVYFEIGALP